MKKQISEGPRGFVQKDAGRLLIWLIGRCFAFSAKAEVGVGGESKR